MNVLHKMPRGTHLAWLAAWIATTVLVSAAVALAAEDLAATRRTTIATVDVAELYRLEERRITARLVTPEATDAERARALAEAAGFGEALQRHVAELATQCRCLVLHRGALIGSGLGRPAADLTPELARRLGLKVTP